MVALWRLPAQLGQRRVRLPESGLLRDACLKLALGTGKVADEHERCGEIVVSVRVVRIGQHRAPENFGSTLVCVVEGECHAEHVQCGGILWRQRQRMFGGSQCLA